MASNGYSFAFSLKLTDLNDRELLALVHEQRDQEGWTDAKAVATALWPSVMENGAKERQEHAVRCVAIRMGWMNRYGVLERFLNISARKVSPGKWQLTDQGLQYVNGRLTSTAARTLESLGGVQSILAIQEMSERVGSEGLVRTLARRAWAYGQARPRPQ